MDGFVCFVVVVWWGFGKYFVYYYVWGGVLVNCVCIVEKEGWEIELWIEKGDYVEFFLDFLGWYDMIGLFIVNMDYDSCYKWVFYDCLFMK